MCSVIIVVYSTSLLVLSAIVAFVQFFAASHTVKGTARHPFPETERCVDKTMNCRLLWSGEGSK